jgi:hypothetical protein
MKEQYVGDVNDYRKYALLRHFAIEGGVRVGVCWMLTPPDTGNLQNYLLEPQRWRDYDQDLFDRLTRILGRQLPNRLRAIESARGSFLTPSSSTQPSRTGPIEANISPPP